MSTVRQSLKSVLVLSLIGVLSGSAWAAGQSGMTRSSDEFSTSPSLQSPDVQRSDVVLFRASKLIGSDVKGSDGSNLGKIYDIVLTPDLHSVSYIALSRGGAFGLGRSLYTVPWSALKEGPGKTYYLPITENHLLTMQGFNEAYWPTGLTAAWVAGTGRVGMAAEQAITREESREVQNRRVSKIMGINVKDAQGEKSGDIRDFVIAHESGQVVYTIVSHGGIFGLGVKYAAVPPAAINIEPRLGVATLTVDRSTLTASAFPPARWPDLSSSAFEQRVATLYGTQPAGGMVFGYVPPESSVNVESKAKMHGTKECPMEHGSALGYQAPSSSREYEAFSVTPESPGVLNIDFTNRQTIEGTVVDMGKLGRAAGPGMLALRLKTADDKIVTVHLGPRDYLSKQNFYIVDGDRIAVTGAHATVAGRPIFVATDINSDGQVLRLRDTSGHPLWLQPTFPEENEAADAATDMPEGAIYE